MRAAARWAGVLLVAALAWPEFRLYSGERDLREASRLLTQLMTGAVTGTGIGPAAQRAQALAARAATALGSDPRPPLLEGTAWLILRLGPDARATLERGIRQGERPELTIMLGRARGLSGDDAGARQAFLRTAWINPYSIDTLPAAIREPILAQVRALEQELTRGTVIAVPALPK
jgi:hypothetical protein